MRADAVGLRKQSEVEVFGWPEAVGNQLRNEERERREGGRGRRKEIQGDESAESLGDAVGIQSVPPVAPWLRPSSPTTHQPPLPSNDIPEPFSGFISPRVLPEQQ